jgi:hypothetical protein
VAVLALAAPAAAQAAQAELPPSQDKPPPGYRLSGRQAIRIADRTAAARRERTHRRLAPTAYTKGPGRWQVSYFEDGRELAQVQVDDTTRAVLEQWTGYQVAWSMARGYSGAFGRKLNAPYVWLPLCLLFLLPFLDPRRPLRLLHLDLLVLLAFGVSHVYFNRGDIGVSVPLALPVLAYLLVRLLVAGMRGRERQQALVPLMRPAWLAIGLVLLVAFRIGLNVVDSNVIDVGYSGVIGADRIVDGDRLYGPGFGPDNEHGDTYGPVTYLAYVPFEQALPWSGRWDDLPAAHGAALAFDLLTLMGLFLLGRRLRAGPEGRTLGLALAWAWASYPYALIALETNTNDSLVGLFSVAALLALTIAPRRPALSAATRAAAIGLGAAAKFAPLALAPLFAGGTGERSPRRLALFGAVLVAVIAAAVVPFLSDGGFRELYDRTLGYQVGRPSPFSIWGQEQGLEPLHTAVKVAVVGLALLVAFVPRRRTPVQVAALAAAVLVALEIAATHWFYLYVVWFAPLALVALLAPLRPAAPPQPRPRAAADPERRAEPVPA